MVPITIGTPYRVRTVSTVYTESRIYNVNFAQRRSCGHRIRLWQQAGGFGRRPRASPRWLYTVAQTEIAKSYDLVYTNRKDRWKCSRSCAATQCGLHLSCRRAHHSRFSTKTYTSLTRLGTEETIEFSASTPENRFDSSEFDLLQMANALFNLN